MNKYRRLFIALTIILSGLALLPSLGLSAQKFEWQSYANAYQPRVFSARLAGSAEVPPVQSDAQGRALFRLNDTRLRFQLLAGHITNVTAAHIHCAPAGVNGPVGVTLFSGGPITIPGVGVLATGNVTAPDAGNSCGWATLADVVAAMRSGDTYVNYHTLAFPAGEIRGQIE
jgi:hypothetical protein